MRDVENVRTGAGLERQTAEAATPRASEDSLSDAMLGPPPDRPRSRIEVQRRERRRGDGGGWQGKVGRNDA